MKKYIFFFIAILGCITLNAQKLNIGIKLQKTHFMYWENGISVQYSFSNFKPGQFYLGVDYVTSRLGTAFNSNALKQDSYIATVAWHFRKGKPFHVTTKINAGFFNVNLGEEIFKELPHSAFLLSPEIGLSYDFKQLPIIVNLGTGYNIGFKNEAESPGTLQPFFYNFTIYYELFKITK